MMNKKDIHRKLDALKDKGEFNLGAICQIFQDEVKPSPVETVVIVSSEPNGDVITIVEGELYQVDGVIDEAFAIKIADKGFDNITIYTGRSWDEVSQLIAQNKGFDPMQKVGDDE